MDILKYCFGIDPVEGERERMRREKRRRQRRKDIRPTTFSTPERR